MNTDNMIRVIALKSNTTKSAATDALLDFLFANHDEDTLVEHLRGLELPAPGKPGKRKTDAVSDVAAG